MAELKDGQCFELSPEAISFLLKLARHAYQENTRPIKLDSDSSSDLEECLTAEALRSIFATALEPGESHPWMDPPAYKVHVVGCVIGSEIVFLLFLDCSIELLGYRTTERNGTRYSTVYYLQWLGTCGCERFICQLG